MTATYFEKLKDQADHTLGWDVAVNYGEKEINQVLANAHAESDASHSITKLEFQIRSEDPWGDEFTVDYCLQLAAPKIQFSYNDTVGYFCELTIPICGGTTVAKKIEEGEQVKKEKKPVEDNIDDGVYQLSVRGLLLATASGSTSTSTPADTPFVFEDSGKDGTVVIDFPTSRDLTVDVEDGPNAAKEGKKRCKFMEDSYRPLVRDAVRDELRITHKDVRLELARVNPARPPQDSRNAVQLQPKSFVFAVLPEKDWGEAILTLFIQTGSTNNGLRNDTLGSKWRARWLEDIGCSPLYPGHTASILFRKQTVYNVMIKPSINRKGWSSSLNDTKGNLTIALATGQKIHRARYVENNSVMGPWSSRVDIKEISEINADPDPISISFATEDKRTYCSGDSYYSYHFEWGSEYGNPEYPVFEHGGVTVTNTIDTRLGSTTLVDDYTFKIGVSIRKDDWKHKVDPDSQGFWDKFTGGRENVPEWVEGLAVEVPSFDIDCGSMEFFLTTNLLTPSRKVIRIDKDLGLQVVGAVYIGGDVIT